MKNSCPNCGFVFDTTGSPAYCPKCGASQTVTEEIVKPDSKKCPKCGKLNIVEANFCTDCGSDLKQLLME